MNFAVHLHCFALLFVLSLHRSHYRNRSLHPLQPCNPTLHAKLHTQFTVEDTSAPAAAAARFSKTRCCCACAQQTECAVSCSTVELYELRLLGASKKASAAAASTDRPGTIIHAHLTSKSSLREPGCPRQTEEAGQTFFRNITRRLRLRNFTYDRRVYSTSNNTRACAVGAPPSRRSPTRRGARRPSSSSV